MKPSSLFSLNWKDVIGAVVSAVISAVLAYIATLTNIADVSLSQVINIALVTAAASLAKSFTTDGQGYLLGSSLKVK